MTVREHLRWLSRPAVYTLPIVLGLATVSPVGAAAPVDVPGEVTFAKDIAPILQRSCQNCHRPDGVGPMPLVTYEEVRPWARAIKQRTGIRDRAGAMPPWYIEKNIGIQEYKNDPSLSDLEVAKIAKWVDTGAPRGNPADMPPPRNFADAGAGWTIGEPDLVVSTPEVLVKANTPDWWGELESVPTGLTEDRYVAALEMREVNDIPSAGTGRTTVGGRYIFHHMIWGASVPGDPSLDQFGQSFGNWPIHEVGRNADTFDPRAGRLLRAGSVLNFLSTHLHSNGNDTRGRLEFGFKLHPVGYKPTLNYTRRGLGNGVDIDIKPMEANQKLEAFFVLPQHTKITTFEPHMHAPGWRMCLDAIWGLNIQTLSCAGYDHNWVRVYEFTEDSAPLLPKGTILRITGYFDNTPANTNVPDPRNWSGSGNRSVANMFIDLGHGLELSDEEFQAEMARRREKLSLTKNNVVIGCPLCLDTPRPTPTRPAANP